jgi:hypothetical protein
MSEEVLLTDIFLSLNVKAGAYKWRLAKIELSDPRDPARVEPHSAEVVT